MRLSVIVPTLNEAAHIAATLAPLQTLRARGTEVIVVDGGSSDGTVALARPLCDRVFDAPCGRARQMNAGAAASTGELLLFLHADSVPPDDADTRLERAFSSASARWGRFDVTISGVHWMFPVIAWFMNKRSRLTGIATGDQGLFALRRFFDSIGGFPDQPLMEDIGFCARALRAGAAPVFIDARIQTSGRRWERHGVWRTMILMWRLRLSYSLGATPESIHRAYYGRSAP